MSSHEVTIKKEANNLVPVVTPVCIGQDSWSVKGSRRSSESMGHEVWRLLQWFPRPDRCASPGSFAEIHRAVDNEIGSLNGIGALSTSM